MKLRTGDHDDLSQPGYRSELYDQYVTIQFPAWSQTNERASTIWAKAALHRMKGWLPADPGAKCLDLGCGAGPLMLALKGAGYHDVTGVDLAPEAVALARRNGLKVTHGDVKNFLGGTENTFDLVSAFDLVEHFNKDELLEILRLIRKRLRPGGTFIFQTPNALSPWAAHYRYGDLTHELILNQRSANAALKLTGFENIEFREVAPFVHGLPSAMRYGLWKILWTGCAIWNLAETGCLHGGVYTRNMMVKANKRGSDDEVVCCPPVELSQ